MALGWYLVSMSSPAIARGRELLKRHCGAGFEIYYPQTKTLQPVPRRFLSHAQRRDNVQMMRPRIEPLFPGYPFLRFDPLCVRDRDRLFGFVGVRGIVCAGGAMVPVEQYEIDKLIARELEGGGTIPGTTEVAALFAVGDQVRIIEGPFASFYAEVSKVGIGDLDESARVELLVNLFGRSTRTELNACQIERV